MPADVFAPSRRLRRKRFFLKASLIFAAILLFLLGVTASIYIPKFRINEISIEGTAVLDKEQLKEEAFSLLRQKFWGIFPYDNIFILPKERIIATLSKKFPLIKKVTIKNDFSRKVFISVEERKPEALWCKKDFCAFLDEAGFIFEPAPVFSGTIFPKFFDERETPADIGKEILPAAEFQKLHFVLETLEKKNFNVVKTILKDSGLYEIHLDEGWYILFNEKNNAETVSENLELILENNIKEKRPQLEYIDLRFGNKIFFKLK